MISQVRLRRFKRFADQTFNLDSDGLTICAGPNSSGKSTLLHGLAVWAFGVLVLKQFKGPEAILEGYKGQGAGISDDDFTPINLPDLRHLWQNLKTQIPGEGYSMSVTVKWVDEGQNEQVLTMSFSLVQDRLYIKPEDSNLTPNSTIPTVVYVPPVAGLDAREEFATAPKRRAMLGRGLAGAVLRNYLFDLEQASRKQKEALKAAKGVAKLGGSALKRFRESDPWERLNSAFRNTFGVELRVDQFDPDFHTVLRVMIQPKVRLENGRWKNSGPARDVMVEGAGAQQWLTVLTFALAPETSVLLLDEPDAHLFTGLKLEMLQHLEALSSEENGPQILLATHATEILKRHDHNRILDFSGKKPSFLSGDIARAKLISGLGDDYAPLIEKARSSRKLLITENDSDRRILESLANILGMSWPAELACMSNTDKHGDRLKIYRSLSEAIDGLHAVSLRDKDNTNIGDIDESSLVHKGTSRANYPDFLPLTLRRREIENYALIPDALSRAVGQDATAQWWKARGWAWPHDPNVEEHLRECDIKDALKNLLGKTPAEKVFAALKKEEIHTDLQVVLRAICR